jgi:hypothetical protein
MDSLSDKTHQERQEAMKSKHEDFQQWLKDNNIPTDLLPKGGPGFHHRRHMGPDITNNEVGNT